MNEVPHIFLNVNVNVVDDFKYECVCVNPMDSAHVLNETNLMAATKITRTTEWDEVHAMVDVDDYLIDWIL